MEQWKSITEFSEYEVSDLSRVRNKHGRILRQVPNQKGYYRICFTVNKKVTWRSGHRLSAIEFIPNPENLPQINHKDGNKLNNSIDNLEWCTNGENQRHRFQVLRSFHGSKGYTQRKKNAKSRDGYNTRAVKVDQLDKETLKFIKTWDSITEAHAAIDARGIWRSLKDPRKSCGGYKWKINNMNQTWTG